MSRMETEFEKIVATMAKRRAREQSSVRPTEADLALARLVVLRDLRDALVKDELPRATRDARAQGIHFKALQAALGHASPTTIQMWAKMADELPPEPEPEPEPDVAPNS